MQDKITKAKHLLSVVLMKARHDNKEYNMYRISLKLDCGHKHIKPPKNCSHKYSLFVINCFGNV